MRRTIKNTRYVLFSLTLIIIALILIIFYPHKKVISLFPLQHYSQNISTWINPSNPNFDTPLLTSDMQKKRQQLFLDHYDGELSPWSEDEINAILQQPIPNDLVTMEEKVFTLFDNAKVTDPTDIGYGENFRPYTENWINKIKNNIESTSSLNNLHYQANHRAITIDNLHARALPTDDVYFYNFEQPGQGYPFDNLQVSAIWAGTPVYVLMESKDHAWSLVITPACIGWIKNSGIAPVDDAFVNTWRNAAQKNLIAITKTETSILDDKNDFLLMSYVGMVFPIKQNNTETGHHFDIMVPIKGNNNFATIKTALVSHDNATVMPLTATPHNFSLVMQTLIDRPYGWGGMYFYNDCSAELKNLFTPFGIWLPRHSSDQVSAEVGKVVDMNLTPPQKRMEFLQKNGKPFLTIVYIGGHVFLDIGNYPAPENASHSIIMTYQNIWGLAPKSLNRRAIIGKSVLLPLLLSYPEDRSLNSLANKKHFQIAYLDELPEPTNLHLKETGIRE